VRDFPSARHCRTPNMGTRTLVALNVLSSWRSSSGANIVWHLSAATDAVGRQTMVLTTTGNGGALISALFLHAT